MVCEECKNKDIQIDTMKSKLKKIKDSNFRLQIIIHNINNSLKPRDIITTVTNFFYSFFRYKKDKIKIL
tara:strand:+ start:257 stop:463 length:207 start_codon:yes stop_codon:yes gene_type:complete